jgi:hypothetical protein
VILIGEYSSRVFVSRRKADYITRRKKKGSAKEKGQGRSPALARMIL